MASEKTTKYYRSRLSGLSVIVGGVPSGEVAPETVRFVPYEERWEGDKVVIGYLATDNAVAQRKLKDDINVEEIDEDTFVNSTNSDVNPKVRRAPY